jgi:hypothetical protein
MAFVQLRVDLTDSGQAHALRYELDGTPYKFLFRYNAIADLWFMDLRDDVGNLLLAGQAITVSEGLADDEILDILAIVRARTDVPPGRLFAYDTEGSHVESGLEDIDDRVVLLYEEAT